MSAYYDYDGQDRRVVKTVTQSGATTVTRTLWDGADEFIEIGGTTTFLRMILQGPGVDDRVAVIDASGAPTYLHRDRLGSTIATSNASGQVSETFAYSPYGEAKTGTPTTGTPWRYTGRHFDAETGLYSYRARYYAPRLGQFLETDPIGTRDDPNLYGYVAWDPVNRTDPTGECWGCVKWAVKFATKGGDVAATTAGVAMDAAALVSPTSTPLQRAEAAVSLISEVVSPVSLRDARAVTGALGAGAKQGDRASTLTPGPYAARSVPAHPGRPTANEQRTIDEIGGESGCHTCGAREPGRESGKFTGDHQPSTALSSPGTSQQYYPHCDSCSRRQAGEVTAESRRRKEEAAKPQ